MSCIEGAILFADVETEARRRLVESELGGLLPGEGVADVFCGAGGWGEGGKRVGIRVDAAVNHWDRAIHTHALNNPWCNHHLGDAWRARPREVLKAAGVRKLGLLLASAACTTHSKAKGSAPVSKRVHMLGWCIARWMEEGRPRCVEIENVPEWVDWGPLIAKRDERGRVVRDAQGRIVRVQDPARKGQHFRRWWRYCQRLGYVMEMRVLDAVDFGGASRRKRLFIKARRDGMPICWPEVTHGQIHRRGGVDRTGVRDSDGFADTGEGRQAAVPARGRVGGQQRRAMAADPRDQHPKREDPPRLSPYRAAADIIDWSDLGTSIFERPRPLKPKTLARIAEGIRRFVLNDPQPFVLRVTQTGENAGWKVWPASDPMPTQTTRQDVAVCVPVVAPQNSGVFGQRVDEPGPTITTKGHQSLITPILASAGGSGYAGKARRIDRLLNTVKTDNRQAIVSPVMVTTGYGEREGQRPRCNGVQSPLNGVVAQNVKQAVVSPVMVNFRGTSGGHVQRSASGIGEPLRAITTEGTHHALCAALLCTYYGNSTTCRKGDEPLGCVTTLDRHALVCVLIEGVEYVMVDILFRMLRPHELAAAMGFPAEYQWPKSQRDATRLIGNAVHVDMAAALLGATFPRMVAAGDERREVAA